MRSRQAGNSQATSPGRHRLPAAGTASAQEPDYVIATDTTFAPFEFQDAGGQLVGIDMDLIREIAEDQDFTVDIKPLGFDAALQAVQANQAAGVIAGMSITDERKAVFDFSDPYFESGVQMVVVTHEMGFAREVASRVMFMADGDIVEDAPPGELFDNPNHPRLRDFLSKVL
ncbi:transporter substrate-binding domain-containing protein [Mycobacterium sp. ITM-2016-00317]|uniref:transporter substrate-binding domain-containing protein n=1 Tax=Mycobacterium sp. ITM-2016-00317 TaxID=2099694 RepID=UPI00287F5891|nr:transporter substrate-binding domain-containing protein [Mycobacterium sp. ITM-2016-00317]WNG86449.1 transporter substrate-binding domain-containing protein [Mycobacterium sp. ITM-2016-00317]